MPLHVRPLSHSALPSDSISGLRSNPLRGREGIGHIVCNGAENSAPPFQSLSSPRSASVRSPYLVPIFLICRPCGLKARSKPSADGRWWEGIVQERKSRCSTRLSFESRRLDPKIRYTLGTEASSSLAPTLARTHHSWKSPRVFFFSCRFRVQR